MALLCFAAAACFPAYGQATIRVPQDQPTIQGAIDAANNGDTVLVSPGTYKVNLDFKGKAITLTTGATAYTVPVVAATVLLAADANLGIVTFRSQEGPGSVLNGFTLQAGVLVPSFFFYLDTGDDSYETSVYGSSRPNAQGNSPDASATITNNRFSQGLNGVSLLGGEIAGNYFTGFVGPMILSGAHVHDNLFENNPNGTIEMFGGVFEDNVLRNNSVIPNDPNLLFADTYNALININSGVFQQNLVYGNYNQFLLGIVNDGFGPPTAVVAENTFASNTVSPAAAPIIPTNCMGTCLPFPTAAQIVYLSEEEHATGNKSLIVNNIFSTSSPGPAIYCPTLIAALSAPASDTLQFDHNLFNAASGPIFDTTCRQQIMPSGNTMSDPLFVNAGAGDYHLTSGSPAIDSGNNSLLAELAAFGYPLTVDYDGNPRPVDATGLGYPVLDRGAYEFPGIVDAQPTNLLLTPSSYTPFTSQTFTVKAALSSALGPPPGTITLLEDGLKVGSALARGDGTAVFTFPSPTVAGVHEFEADYPGLYPFTPATSLKLVLYFAVTKTTLSLYAQPKTAPPGQAIVLTVYATANDNSVPSPVSLTDNGNPLATLLPDVTGRASLSVTTFSPGAHTIVATYAGDATHGGSTASLVVTVTQDDFAITLQPPTVTVSAGQRGQVNILLASLGIFAGTLNLSAGAAPQYVTLSFGSASAPLTAGATSSTTLIINTGTTLHAGLRQDPLHCPQVPFAVVALLILPFTLNKRRLAGVALAAFLTLALTACIGCTNIEFPLVRAAPGTYIIPIIATDSTTGLTHVSNLTLNITP